MHLLKYFITFASDLWFEYFGDLVATTSQNSKSNLLDSATTNVAFPYPDLERNWSSAVLLPEDNKVYIIPALSNTLTNNNRRGLIYDIATDTYTASSATFQTPSGSSYYQIKDGVLLKNGKILISRGYDPFSSGSYPYYLYDIKTDSLEALSSTTLAMQLMVKLKDDKVFIFGFNFSGNTKAAAIFNPDDNTITSIGNPPLSGGSDDSRLIMLPNGKLLITSGTQGTNGVLYDQDTNTYSSSTMAACSGACLMDDGRVFYVRCLSIQSGLVDTNGYIWNPTTNTTTTIPNVLTNFSDRQAALSLLPDGRILIIRQGAGDFGDRSARIFNPDTNTTTSVPGGLAWPGGYDAALLRKVVLLPNGKALVVSTRRWHSGNKFQLITGLFSNGVQFPTRQLKGSYLNNSPWFSF